jgi:hypothetical protein
VHWCCCSNFILNNTCIMNTINVIWTWNHRSLGILPSVNSKLCYQQLSVCPEKKCLILALMHKTHRYFTFFQSIFSWGEITCVWVLNLCLNYQFLQQLAVDKVKDGILYNKVWKDNWTYLISINSSNNEPFMWSKIGKLGSSLK